MFCVFNNFPKHVVISSYFIVLCLLQAYSCGLNISTELHGSTSALLGLWAKSLNQFQCFVVHSTYVFVKTRPMFLAHEIEYFCNSVISKVLVWWNFLINTAWRQNKPSLLKHAINLRFIVIVNELNGLNFGSRFFDIISTVVIINRPMMIIVDRVQREG